MIPAEFLELIENNFQEEEKQVLVTCLLQDKRVLEALSQLEQSEIKEIDRLKNLENWKPAYFAFLLKDEKNWKYDLSEIIKDKKIYEERFLSQLPDSVLQDENTIDLTQAAEIALGVFALLRSKKWPELEKELFHNFQFNHNAGLMAACLLGFINSSEFIAKEITASKNPEIKKMFAYSIFCNPVSLANQEKDLKSLLADLNSEEKIEILQFIAKEGRITLARLLAQDELEKISKVVPTESQDTLQKELSDLQTLNYLADIHFLEGNEAESISEIERLMQKLDALKQDAQKKHQNILSCRESKKVQAEHNQASLQQYDWKRIPDFNQSLDLKKTTYQNIEEYLQSIEEKISKNPKDSQFLQQIAEMYHSLGDHLRSIHYLKIARILDEKNQDLDKKIFCYLIEKHQWQTALKQIKSVNKRLETNFDLKQFYVESKDLLAQGEITTVMQRLKGLPSDQSSEDAESLFEIGDLYMDMEEWEKAQNYFEQSISAENTDYKAWINLYYCLCKTQQKEKAEQTLTQTIEIFQKRNGFYEQLILAMLGYGDQDRGLSLIDKIDVENGTPEAIAGIVHYLNQEQLTEHAYELALKAIRSFPLNSDLGMITAHVLMENGENEQAIRYLRLIKEEKGADADYIILKSVSALKSSKSIFPLGTQRLEISELNSILCEIQKLPADDYWRGLIEAEIKFLLDDTNKAATVFKKLILENSLSKNRQDLWRAQVGLACTMLKIRQTETAITLLNEASRAQQENLSIYGLLVDAYREKDLDEEAVAVVKKARLICAKDKKITAWYGNQMLKLGKPEEVRSYFSDEAMHYQSSPDFLIERMRFENQYGSQNNTKMIINDLIALEKTTSKDLQTALKIAQESHLHDLSLKIIQKLQKVDQDDPETCILNACVYWNQGDYTNAVSCLDTIQQIGVWSMVCESITILADGKNVKPQKLLQILENRQTIENQLLSLPEHVHSIFPSEWTRAFSSNDIWIKLVLLTMFEAKSDELDSQFMNSLSDFPTNDVLTSTYLAIHSWLKNGHQGSMDWVRLLESLNSLQDAKKEEALTGFILNILLENGNEVAAAAKINTLSTEMLEDQNILFAKARLLQRNNNATDAHTLYAQALAMRFEPKNSAKDLDENILVSLSNLQKWKADCAFEMGDWEEAIQTYLYCLDFSAYFSVLKEKILSKILHLGLKEWSFKKIGSSRNLPNILQKQEFLNLSAQINLLPSDMRNQYSNIHKYLLNTESAYTDIQQTQTGFISVVNQILYSSQIKDYDSVLKIIEANQKEEDLPLIVLGLFPPEKYRDLIPVFNAALFQNKKNPYLSAGLAKIFIYEKEADLAINTLETAIGFLDNEPTWRAQLAILYEEKGELQKAVSHSEQAVKLNPKNQENMKEYLENLYLIKDYKKVIEIFEKNQELFEGDHGILRIMVDAYYQNEEFRKALSSINMLKSTTEDDLDLILIQARIAEQLGSIPKAMELIREAYRIDPKSPEVIIELAKIKSFQENEEFGLEIIEKALESNIVNNQLILEKTAYLEKIRGSKRAIGFLEGYLEKVEDADTALLNRYAQLLQDAGNQDGSLQVYEKSIQMNDNQPFIHKMIGILSIKKGNLDNAVFHLDKAIKQNPHEMDAYLALTETLISRREGQRAESIIKIALDNCKEHYLIYEKASKVYNQLGDSEKAEAYLRKATALNPTDDGLREKLGIVLANRIFEKR
ncbi:MAG: tetratricopeptide repeat protein [Anaerolineaceae bacterium]